MAGLDYPPDKLQVLLLLEADDDVTIAAAEACADSEVITIVLVPPAEPRTKPKACNYGLHFATGEIVTIYDAEDRARAAAAAPCGGGISRRCPTISPASRPSWCTTTGSRTF